MLSFFELFMFQSRGILFPRTSLSQEKQYFKSYVIDRTINK